MTVLKQCYLISFVARNYVDYVESRSKTVLFSVRFSQLLSLNFNHLLKITITMSHALRTGKNITLHFASPFP